MITIDDIKKWAKPHPTTKFTGKGGKQTRFGNHKVEFSIVGGDTGLYGDFVDTFEVAIFDVQTRDFITRFFYPNASDDVIGWMKSEEVEKLVNSVIKREDLSIEVQFPCLEKQGGGSLTHPVGPKKRGFGLSFFIFDRQNEVGNLFEYKPYT